MHLRPAMQTHPKRIPAILQPPAGCPQPWQPLEFTVQVPHFLGGCNLVGISAARRQPITAQIAGEKETNMTSKNQSAPRQPVFMTVAQDLEKAKVHCFCPVDHDAHAVPCSTSRMKCLERETGWPFHHRTQVSAVGGDVAKRVVDKGTLALFHEFQTTLQFLRQPKVIGIKESDVSAPRHFKRAIAREGRSPVGV